MRPGSDQVPHAGNGFISPHIFDTDIDGPMHDADMFFDSALPIDSPGQFFRDGASGISPFQSPVPVKTQALQNGRGGVQARPAPSLSSESSIQDSSSDSSEQHKRKSSSTSSQSAPSGSDTVMADASGPSQWNGSQSFFKKESTLAPAQFNTMNFDSFELSNKAMENDFDFDSAASSPSPLLSASNTQYTGPRCLAMPYEDSPRISASLLPHTTAPFLVRLSIVYRDEYPLSLTIGNTRRVSSVHNVYIELTAANSRWLTSFTGKLTGRLH